MEACIRADTAARVMPPRVEGLRVGQDRGRHSWPCCPCLLTLPSIFHPLHPRDQVGASGERRAGVESATALCCGQAHGPSKLRIQITTRQRCVPDPAQTCNIQRSQRPGCCQTAPRQPPCRLRRVPHQPRPGGFFLGFWWPRRNLEASPEVCLAPPCPCVGRSQTRSARHPMLAIGWAWPACPADAR